MVSRTSELAPSASTIRQSTQEADREAGDGPGHAAAEQPERDDQRRQHVGAGVEDGDPREEGELEEDADDHDQRQADEDLAGDDHPREPPVRTWTMSRLARSAKGRRRTCWLASCSSQRGLGDFADRQVRREERGEPLRFPARGDDRRAAVDRSWSCRCSRGSVLRGRRSPGASRPGRRCGTILAEIALASSVISVTWAEPPSTEETRPTSAPAAHHRVVDVDPVAAADVDRDGRVPDRRRCARSPCAVTGCEAGFGKRRPALEARAPCATARFPAAPPGRRPPGRARPPVRP